MSARYLAATLFPLRGLEGATFRFRALRVREPLPDDNQRPVRLQRCADRLWRRDLHCPVYPTMRFGWPGFLAPDEDVTQNHQAIEIVDVPDRTYHIELTGEVVEVSVDTAQGTERDLVCRMLERPFTLRLLELWNQVWRAEWTLFFSLRPENFEDRRDVVNAYRGFKFGVVLLDGIKPYLGIDARTRYVGRRSLAEFTSEARTTTLGQHLDLNLRLERRASFLRDNGSVKIPCRYVGPTGQTVSEFMLADNRSVLQYYQQTYPTIGIPGRDEAVFVVDRAGGGRSLATPASRLFPIFTTEYDGVRACSVRPWMTPQARREAAAGLIQQIGPVRYAGKEVVVVDEVFTAQRTVFNPPSLEFGNGYRLEPFPPRRPEDADFDEHVVRWSSRKYPALLHAGPQHNEPLPDVFVLFPDTLEREVREPFLNHLRREVALQTRQSLRIVQQRPYAAGPAERMGGALFRSAAEIKSLRGHHLALVVLSDRHAESVHGELKDRIRPLLSQCLTESTARSIATQRNPRRARSQIRNLALAVVIEAGVKPWVLADPLHHDLHVGIDLLYGRIGYHFLYGTGGRLIQEHFGEARERGRMLEAIKRPVLQSRLYETIRAICEEGHSIKSIIIHRDGRWWHSENVGLQRALTRLQVEGVLPGDVCCAVAEVRKNHLPVRLLTHDPATALLQNPLPGTYLLLDEDNALLTTTGRPGAWDTEGGRTASTLLLRIVERIGQVSLKEIIEDAYRLTHLNWSSPDIEIAVPVTIRWTDESLRETFRPLDEDEEEESAGGAEEAEDVTDRSAGADS